jgi:hypothetical protein
MVLAPYRSCGRTRARHPFSRVNRGRPDLPIRARTNIAKTGNLSRWNLIGCSRFVARLDPRSQRRDVDDERETTSRRGHGDRRRATLCWARVGRIADPVLALGKQHPVGFLDDVDDADGRHSRPRPRFRDGERSALGIDERVAEMDRSRAIERCLGCQCRVSQRTYDRRTRSRVLIDCITDGRPCALAALREVSREAE